MRRYLKMLLTPAQRTIACACAFGLAILPVSDYRPAPRPAPPQTPAPGQSGPQPPKIVPQSMVCALWRTDQGFVSTIRIKNGMIVGPVTVTPVLFMADGTEYDLAPVNLVAGGIAFVDVNDALENAPPAVANHLSQYGSAALRYQWAAPGTVVGSTQIMNDAESLVFDYPFMPVQADVVSSHTVEGLWWKHDPGVGGFLAVSNTTAQPTSATLDGTTADGDALAGETLSLPPHGMELVNMDTVFPANAANRAGGVRVRFRGGAMDVVVAGGLMNAREGYSAAIPLAMHDVSASPAPAAAPMSYASVGMLVGKPDPTLGFPDSTRFTPYAFMRNTTGKTLAASLAVHYMLGGQPRTIPLPAWNFSPYQSAEIPIERLLDSAGLAGYDGNVTLAFSYTGGFGDLVVATGSVDQTGTYVFEVPVSATGQSWAKESPFWTTANGSDTMFTLWNSGTAPEDLVATITWNGMSGHYNLPVHLDAGASLVIDMAQLIALNRPDSDGKTIPPDVREGSAMFAGTGGMRQAINLVLSGGEYNVETATCCPFWYCCFGVVSYDVSPDPMTCPDNFICPARAKEGMSDGGQQDVTDASNWSSDNTSVATVGTGDVSGVGLGTADIHATIQDQDGGLTCSYIGGLCNVSTWANVTHVTVVAIPVNYRQTAESSSGGVLYFTYGWDSSSGSLNDLSACGVFEHVDYPPSGLEYYWASPPYATGTHSDNPTVGPSPPVPGTQGFAFDQQLNGGFLSPYVYNDFSAAQYYYATCSNYNGGAQIYLAGPISIERTVSQNTNGTWKYVVTKSGYPASVNPLP
ncbi:MAG TPA: Ig-like domain-containing protein [Candidatus Acidoferrales bacterium]|nr:Ig-like domain-containing protein [Candidatus Acidoferrales bacterium]